MITYKESCYVAFRVGEVELIFQGRGVRNVGNSIEGGAYLDVRMWGRGSNPDRVHQVILNADNVEAFFLAMRALMQTIGQDGGKRGVS